MTYLLVGESPNPATARRPDLWLVPDDSGIPHTANRLRDLAGWTTEEYLRVFSRRDNVLPLPPRGGRWRKGHREIADARAARMLRLGLPIVALGRHAARALDLDGSAPCQFYDQIYVGGPGPNFEVRVAYLPHTSGLNRWWNDEDNRAAGVAFLRGLQ